MFDFFFQLSNPDVNQRAYAGKKLAVTWENGSSGFPTRSDINQPVQSVLTVESLEAKNFEFKKNRD